MLISIIYDLFKQEKQHRDIINKIKSLGIKTRYSNLHEIISECICCLYLGLSKIDIGDAFNEKTQQKVQIKCTTMTKNKRDCTSFSPNNNDDLVCFIEINVQKEYFYIYKPFPLINLSSIQITKKHTFQIQQKNKRRPRLSIREYLKSINQYTPIYESNIEEFLLKHILANNTIKLISTKSCKPRNTKNIDRLIEILNAK